MSKKKRTQKDLPITPRDTRAMESSLAELHRFLDEHEFESIDEANALLSSLGGKIPRAKRDPAPLDLAQDKMYEAFDASGKRRVRLAREALAISPDCADAYVLLAEESTDSVLQAKEWFERGVEAGVRALGPGYFEKNKGYFWGLIETRPYMRAREGLAQCLWELGARREAIAHFRDLLELNPYDNQGVRYELTHLYLLEGMNDELGELFRQYPDDPTAQWAYARALWHFRREGDTPRSKRALLDAFECNPHVPCYFAGLTEWPESLPDTMGFGDQSEAAAYVMQAIAEWVEIPDAIKWFGTVFLKETERRLREEAQERKSWIFKSN